MTTRRPYGRKIAPFIGRGAGYILSALVAVSIIAACGGNAVQPRSSTPNYSVRMTGLERLPAKVNGHLVTATALTRDGLLVVGTSAGEVYTASASGKISDGRWTFSKTPRMRLSGTIGTVRVSPDGRFVAAVSGDQIALGDLRGGYGVTGSDMAESASFDSTGSQVAYGGFGVKVFDTRTGHLRATYKQPMSSGGRGTYEDVRFAPAGDRIIAVSAEGVDVWNVGTNKAASPTLTCGCAADGAVLSSDGSRAAFGTADGHMLIMETMSGRVLADRTVTHTTGDHVFAVAFSEDGDLVAGFSSTGAGVLWDNQKKRVIWQGNPKGIFEPTGVDFVGKNALLVRSQTNESDSGTGVGVASFLVHFSFQSGQS
jgi:WD40 repeat protein